MTGVGLMERWRTRDARLVDGLLALVLTVVLQLQLALGDGPDATPLAVFGGLALTLPLAWRRRAPLAVAVAYGAAAALGSALGADIFEGEPPLVAALVTGGLAFYSLGAHADERSALAGLALGVLGLWTTVVVSDHTDLASYLFSAGLVALSPWLAGRTSRARTLRAEALEREREGRSRNAVSEERQRIARELHDVVAHGLVVMVVQAQGARRILDQDPERAREALRAIEQTGQTALSEMRRSLGVLRADAARADLAPQPTLHDLDGLLEEMRRAGLDVDLRIEGERRDLAEGVDRSAYRIVQEALTNTIKHAGFVPTRVTVDYGADELRLEIANTAPPTPARTDADAGAGTGSDDDGGHGLVGMRERVRLYGGELEAGAENGHGFVVRARIPFTP
ncbi:MAG TPA: sensor histidine kinase [Solirubrobacteraceae bacterium]|nr:sensor histidine kinase [Solirubrobacteraceae bacterium]